MLSRTSYGGECTVIDAGTGEVFGRVWIDVEFRRGRREIAIAALDVPESTGALLRDLGDLLLHLDDGRQLRGKVAIILSAETIVTLTFED